MCLLLATLPAMAGSVAGEGSDELSLADVEARVAEVERGERLPPDQKARVLGLYAQVRAALEASQRHAEVAARYRTALESAPKDTAKVQEEMAELLGQASGPASLGVADSASAAELGRRLAQEEVRVTTLESSLAEIEEARRERLARPARLRVELAQVSGTLEDLRDALKAAPPADVGPAEAEAQRTLTRAQIAAGTVQLARLEQELLSHDVRLTLLQARRDLAALQLAQARQRVSWLRARVGDARRVEAAAAVDRAAQAERDASARHPVVRAAAEENAALARRLSGLTSELERASQARQATEETARKVEEDFRRTRRKVELAGVSATVARQLMQERRGLASAFADRARALKRVLRVQAAESRRDRAAVDLESMEVEERRRALASLQGAVDDLMERVEPTMPADERQRVREELLGLLRERQALLERLDGALTGQLQVLGEIDVANARLEGVTRTYAAYLDERLLWIPSTYPITQAALANLRVAAHWLIDPQHWAGARIALESDVRRHPFGWSLLALTVLGLGLVVPAIRRRLHAIAARVRDPVADRFPLTLEALALSLLVALPAPLALGFLGWRLESTPEATDFSQLLGTGLAIGARTLFGLLFLFVVAAPRGLGDAHFRWPAPALRLIRRALWVVLAVGLPAVLVAASLGQFADETYAASLGRGAFIVAMVAVAYFLARVFHPRGALIRPHLQAASPPRLVRLWPLWYPLVVGAPLALVALASVGYYYTAAVLARPALQTLGLVFVTGLVYGLGLRWLASGRRELALKLAREKRRTAQALSAGADAAAQVPLVSPGADLDALDVQARQLLKTVLLLGAPVVLWLIWRDILPAFSLFREVTLWHYSQEVGGQKTSIPVTLWDLARAVVIGVVAGVGARGVPSLLEVALLRHMSLERGSRYAIKTLLQYAIAIVGVLLVFGILGASWSRMQWLVAALGVGLGFGLQEIVANFISGIIILFERPVRVGDRVTVGDLTGTVSNISIRATTITDFDRREILVPNKSFITADVVNWSLSDPITRIKVRVGIAYGSDVKRAVQVMLDTVKALPLVRAHPAPEVWFVGFGASSLDFDVFAFASELTDRLPLTHAVHVALEEALGEAGIEIAFPQHDLHLRTVSPEAGAALGVPRRIPPGGGA